MSYVRSSETENYTEFDWLSAHVAGHFRLYDEFPLNTEFHVNGLGRCKVVDKDTSYKFEYELNPVWIVFECDGSLVKFNGVADSYGGIDWNYKPYRVKKVEKVTFEYV